MDKPATPDQVILVDENDEPIGLAEKVSAHLGEGLLHRAFVVLVFDRDGKLLLQRRSAGKMLWPLFWDATCASHPRKGESYEAAGERRLAEELGFTCKLRRTDTFTYHASFGTTGSEREICAVLVGVHDGPVTPAPDEIADWRWADPAVLLAELEARPETYTPWLAIVLRRRSRQSSKQPVDAR